MKMWTLVHKVAKIWTYKAIMFIFNKNMDI